jgi:exonuclease VII small subunit
MSCDTLHRATSYPNYISWGCFSLVREELEKMIGKLKPESVNLENVIAQLQNEEKLSII